MKYWWIDQIVYSHFLIENWKVKMLETITTHINIEKLNERGKKKKKLNAKLERHLARPPYTTLWGLYFYTYIDEQKLFLIFDSFLKMLLFELKVVSFVIIFRDPYRVAIMHFRQVLYVRLFCDLKAQIKDYYMIIQFKGMGTSAIRLTSFCWRNIHMIL